jgi:hypothetical protein
MFASREAIILLIALYDSSCLSQTDVRECRSFKERGACARRDYQWWMRREYGKRGSWMIANDSEISVILEANDAVNRICFYFILNDLYFNSNK